MAERHPEDEAREYLKGLESRWPSVGGGGLKAAPVARPTSTPPPPPSARRSPADDAMEQAERLAGRNREIAKRTRHLREN